MQETLYASFADYKNAEQAAGALLDSGLRKEDLSVVATMQAYDADRERRSQSVERAAKVGVTTTTGKDAASGAAKGAGVGAGVGAAALIASLFVPGLGLVTGAGALATALATALGASAAGAAVGAVTGYLKDQGVPAEVATQYEDVVKRGGAIIALALPSGDIDRAAAEQILVKYNASDLNGYSYQSLN
jgi:hypothetical protein